MKIFKKDLKGRKIVGYLDVSKRNLESSIEIDLEEEIRKAEFTVAGANRLIQISEATYKTELANLEIAEGVHRVNSLKKLG